MRYAKSTFGLRGVHFVENPPAPTTDKDKKDAAGNPIVEDEKKEFDPATLSPEAKAYFDTFIATKLEEVVKTTAEKTKTDLLDEQKKQKDKDDRAAARKKALDENNNEEVLKLEREQLAADRLEAQRIKDEAASEKLDAIKIRIANELKLPTGFEKRLTGATEKEIREDGVELLKALPKHKIAESEGGANSNSTSNKEQTESAQRIARRLVSF